MRNTVLMLLVAVAAVFAMTATGANAIHVPDGTAISPSVAPPVSGSGAGYYFWDETESSDFAPDYHWIDATVGTNIALTGDDSYVTLTTPFAIRFCGVDKPAGSSFYVGTNMLTSFNAANMGAYGNTDIPNTATPNDGLYPLWDDGYGTTGYVAYQYLDTSGDADVWVVAWDPWRFLGASGSIAFELQFHENTTGLAINNTIEYHYEDVDAGSTSYNNGASATVGLENSTGTAAAKYSYNTASLAASRAIRFMDQDYVDNAIGAFDLVSPADGSEANEGDTVTFDWEDAAYSGSGDLTYTLILSANPDLSGGYEFDAGSESTLDLNFETGDAGTWYWGVEAEESAMGITRNSTSIYSIIINVSVMETSWGSIKTLGN